MHMHMDCEHIPISVYKCKCIANCQLPVTAYFCQIPLLR